MVFVNGRLFPLRAGEILKFGDILEFFLRLLQGNLRKSGANVRIKASVNYWLVSFRELHACVASSSNFFSASISLCA